MQLLILTNPRAVTEELTYEWLTDFFTLLPAWINQPDWGLSTDYWNNMYWIGRLGKPDWKIRGGPLKKEERKEKNYDWTGLKIETPWLYILRPRPRPLDWAPGNAPNLLKNDWTKGPPTPTSPSFLTVFHLLLSDWTGPTADTIFAYQMSHPAPPMAYISFSKYLILVQYILLMLPFFWINKQNITYFILDLLRPTPLRICTAFFRGIVEFFFHRKLQ